MVRGEIDFVQKKEKKKSRKVFEQTSCRASFLYLVLETSPMLPHLYPRRRVPTLLLAAGCVLAVGFPERTAAQSLFVLSDPLLVYVSMQEGGMGAGYAALIATSPYLTLFIFMLCYCLHLGMQCWGGWSKVVLVTGLLCGA